MNNSTARKTGRSAGLLLHISSLPSPYAIGDLGPEAYQFLDFLKASGQRIWQMLPVGPTDAGQSHSPYSSLSAMAGNSLLISPDMLVSKGWLVAKDADAHRIKPTGRVSYEKAAEIRENLLKVAYDRFESHATDSEFRAFDKFCSRNGYWLEDYALFLLFDRKFKGKCWGDWPESVRDRSVETLQKLEREHAADLRYIKWVQFVFDRQWNELRSYASKLEIQLLGDLPFYAGYHSCDVWSRKENFDLLKDGTIGHSAGVPPDVFSESGQAWGMPVYNWKRMKSNKYHWWVQRLKRNLELFDRIRLDHFRAFESYWKIPGGASSAKEGIWEKGPGLEFFEVLGQKLGSLPFVAEDLGELTKEVGELREHLGLQGMKVLQFAFGKDMSQSEFIPHNYQPGFYAFTGTHDNNTTLGWFQKDLDREGRKRLRRYLGRAVRERELPAEMIRLLYSSVAETVIIPVQDVLGLDGRARMNLPGTAGVHNWTWQLTSGMLGESHAKWLSALTALYNR